MPDECQLRTGEAIKKQTHQWEGKINGRGRARRLPPALTLIKQGPSEGKRPLEIDRIDFIAITGERHGALRFLHSPSSCPHLFLQEWSQPFTSLLC